VHTRIKGVVGTYPSWVYHGYLHGLHRGHCFASRRCRRDAVALAISITSPLSPCRASRCRCQRCHHPSASPAVIVIVAVAVVAVPHQPWSPPAPSAGIGHLRHSIVVAVSCQPLLLSSLSSSLSLCLTSRRCRHNAVAWPSASRRLRLHRAGMDTLMRCRRRRCVWPAVAITAAILVTPCGHPTSSLSLS